jgi:hypothetical protein
MVTLHGNDITLDGSHNKRGSGYASDRKPFHNEKCLESMRTLHTIDSLSEFKVGCVFGCFGLEEWNERRAWLIEFLLKNSFSGNIHEDCVHGSIQTEKARLKWTGVGGSRLQKTKIGYGADYSLL